MSLSENPILNDFLWGDIIDADAVKQQIPDEKPKNDSVNASDDRVKTKGDESPSFLKSDEKSVKSITITSPRSRREFPLWLCCCLSESFRTKITDLYNASRRLNANYIRTTRYTPITFLPISLFDQLKRLSNLYFIARAVIALIMSSQLDIPPAGSVIAVCFIMGVTLIKDLYEDICRLVADIKANGVKVERYCPVAKQFEKGKTSNIEVGDLVRVNRGSVIPADLIVLYSSRKDGSCYVETANLDGECNLKKKSAVFHDLEQDKITSGKYEVKMEENTQNLNQFSGVINETHIITNENAVLRGCRLESTPFIIGIVAFVGKKTKMFLNNKKKKRQKFGLLDKNMNITCLILIITQQIMIFILLTMGWILEGNVRRKHWYLRPFEYFTYENQFVQVVLYFSTSYIRLVILTEVFISMAIFTIMEVVKTWQAKKMETTKLSNSEGEEDFRITARSSNLNWDLAFVEIVFSDKTGTLTENLMEFRGAYCIRKYFHCNSKSEIADILKRGNSEKLNLFLLNVLVNNTVSGVENVEGELQYNGESTDEVALCKGFAAENSYVLKDRNTIVVDEKKRVEIIAEIHGKERKFHVIEELKFTSERKRMSVIVQDELSGKTYVFIKGADDVVFERCQLTSNEEKEEFERAINKFSEEGFRILAFGHKEISLMELEEFQIECLKAQNNIYTRDKVLERLFDNIEQDFSLVGITAIEDKLQDGVGDAIEFLLNAGVAVWVLTGDKVQTALNICKTAKLLRKETLIDLTGKKYENDIQKLSKLLEKILKYFQKVESSENEHALVVDSIGVSNLLLHHEEEFIEVIKRFKSVICCRVTPIQKAKIVMLVQKKLKKRGLAIGDGANDVSMIMQANVGVGIHGREGSHAARSADYSLPKFRFIVDLLAVEGRYCYLRSSDCVLLSIYKNASTIFFNFAYSFYSFSTGVHVMDPFVYELFPWFHGLPPAYAGIFERDINKRLLMNDPQLYANLKKNPYYNILKRVLPFLFYGLLQGAVAFFVTYFVGFDTGVLGEGKNSNGSKIFGFVVVFASNLTIFITDALEIRTWQLMSFVSLAPSIFFYLAVILFYSLFIKVDLWITEIETDYFGVPYRAFVDLKFYVISLLIVVVSVGMGFVGQYFFQSTFPLDWQKIRKREKKKKIPSSETVEIELKDFEKTKAEGEIK